MTSLRFLFALLFLIGSASAVSSDACAGSEDPWACRVKDSAYSIASIALNVNEKTLSIYEMSCGEFRLKGGLVTNQIDAKNIRLGVTELSGRCVGWYDYAEVQRGRMELKVGHADVETEIHVSSSAFTSDRVSLSKVEMDVETDNAEVNGFSSSISMLLVHELEEAMTSSISSSLKEASSASTVKKVSKLLSMMEQKKKTDADRPSSGSFVQQVLAYFVNDVKEGGAVTTAEVSSMNVGSPTPDSENGGSMRDGDAAGLWVGITVGCALMIALIGYFIYFRSFVFNKDDSLSAAITYTNEWFTPIRPEEAAKPDGPLHVSLLQNPELNVYFRYSIPVVILGTVAIFLDAHIYPGAASINVFASTNGVVLQDGSIFNLGLEQTVHDMWEAKVYALAIFIVYFSAIWPYVKLFGMLTLWCLPPQYCSLTYRENILIFLDGAGKWALLDFFVLIFMLCAFYLKYETLLFGVFPVKVYVTTQPLWGFYALLWGIITSAIIGHVIVSANRYVTKPSTETLLQKMEKDEPVSSIASSLYVFYRETKEFASSVGVEVAAGAEDSIVTVKHRIIAQWTWLGYAIVHAMFILTVVTYIIGLHTTELGFQLEGNLSVLYTTDDTYYSIIDVGNSISEHSGIPHDAGVQWVQTFFFAFAILAPSLLLVSMLILWNVPMTFMHKSYFMFWTEVVHAWACLDVYAVSSVVGLLQVEEFAKFVMEDCKIVRPAAAATSSAVTTVLGDYSSHKVIAPGLDACFSVIGVFTKDCWLLFLPAILIMFLANLTMSATHHTLIQRVHPDYMSESLDRSAHGEEADVPIGNEKHGMQPLEQGEAGETAAVKKDLSWENYTWQNFGYYALQIMEKLWIVEIIQEDNFLAPVHTNSPRDVSPNAPVAQEEAEGEVAQKPQVAVPVETVEADESAVVTKENDKDNVVL